MFDSFLMTASDILSGIRVRDVLDILIVAFAIYKIIQYIWGTRARQLVQGLMVLAAALFISDVLNLYTVHFILYKGLTYGFIAILIIFYPELRRVLEYLGRKSSLISRRQLAGNMDKVGYKEMIKQMCAAIEYFSSNKVGALIVIERDITLGDIAENATHVDAEVTALLLETIFYEGSALHDGAVIIRGNRIHSAGCVLPLSSDNSLEKTLGTRHRAGLGITEVSDALVFIVSEETGIISMAHEGKITRFLDVKTVEKTLYDNYLSGIESVKPSDILLGIFRRSTDE